MEGWSFLRRMVRRPGFQVAGGLAEGRDRPALPVALERCSICGGKMKAVAAVTDPASIQRYLEGTGHSPTVPEKAPARAPPQAELDFDY